MYRRPDEESARRYAADEAREAAAFRAEALAPKRRLLLVLVVSFAGLIVVAVGFLLYAMREIASALPSSDEECIRHHPDGNVTFDNKTCVNGKRIPDLPQAPRPNVAPGEGR